MEECRNKSRLSCRSDIFSQHLLHRTNRSNSVVYAPQTDSYHFASQLPLLVLMLRTYWNGRRLLVELLLHLATRVYISQLYTVFSVQQCKASAATLTLKWSICVLAKGISHLPDALPDSNCLPSFGFCYRY